MTLSALNRRNVYKQFKEEEYDLLVIGGGITGAGVALDATKRGMKVAVVEMQDFSAGTSSRSTKLVHGGLRYLQKLSQWGVVKTSGQERAIVYENGPHVTTPEHMLLPMHKDGSFGKLTTSLGLRLYDRLAGVKAEERRKMLSVEETLKKAPLLKQEGLRGGGYYVEYRTDDARLTIEVLKKAVEKGAAAVNYLKAIGFNYDEKGKIEGAWVEDQLTQNRYLINAKLVVNAAGPWVENVLSQVESESGKRLLITKGAHLVIDKEHFPLDQAIYFDTETDKRMIFAVPRGNKVYVGTTDTVYEDNKITPRVSTVDRYYIINAINYMFPELKINVEHIESSWAGIRPLIWEEGRSPSEISRKDEIWSDKTGLLTIAGGKLTGYRHMAEEIVDKVSETLLREHKLTFEPCSTKKEPISGGDVGGSESFAAFVEKKAKEAVEHNLTEEEGRELAQFYGSNVDHLFNIASQASPDKMEGLPIDVYTRLIYGLQYEGVVKPADFFIRRTGALFFNITWVDEYKLPVIKLMARYFAWPTATIQQYNAELETALYEARNPIEEEGVIKLEDQSQKTTKGTDQKKDSASANKASKTETENTDKTDEKADEKEASSDDSALSETEQSELKSMATEKNSAKSSDETDRKFTPEELRKL